MAILDIDAKVTGIGDVEVLDRRIKDLETSTLSVNRSMVSWTAGLTATAYAINKVWDAGSSYLNNLEETNNAIIRTTDLETELSTSFGMASASLLEYTGVWDAYREVLVEVANALDVVAGAEAIRRQAQAEHLAFEKDYQKMILENEKIEARRHKKRMAQLEAENKANIRHQKWLTDFEEKAEKDRIAQAKAYEDELIALDASIDAINAETDAQIANSQATEENTSATEENTQATMANVQASKASASASGGSSSQKMDINYLNKERDALNMYQSQGYDVSQQLARLNQQIADLYQVNRDTNDAMRGY